MSTIPVRISWQEWYPVVELETEQDLQEAGVYELNNIKFLPVPLELLGKYRQMVALRWELSEALRAIQDAHREIPKRPTREDRNNKRRLAKQGGAR